MRLLHKILLSICVISTAYSQVSCSPPAPRPKKQFIPLICDSKITPTPIVATIKANEQITYTVLNPVPNAEPPVWTTTRTECATLDPTTGVSIVATGQDTGLPVCTTHIDVSQAGCIGSAILTVIPAAPSQCTLNPSISPTHAEVPSAQAQIFTANNIGSDPAATTWSASNISCATVNPMTGASTHATGHNTTITKCFTDVTAVNGPCYAQALLTVDPEDASCTSTTTNEPPALAQRLGTTLYNDTACAYKDQDIYVYLIGKVDPTATFAVGSIVGQTSDGYPIVEMNVPPSSYPLQIPYFTLNQLKQGGFYIKTGTGFGSHALASARMYISLGSQLNSFVLNSATNYTEPTEITPWDIFEFGYDPTNVKAFGFNTTQVAAFSVPLWFKVAPLNTIPSNPPLPLGIQLRVNTTPIQFGSQQQIINYYGTQNSSGPELFTLNYLKQTDSNGNTRIKSPATQGLAIPLAQTNYFDSSRTNFLSTYTSSGSPNWTFLMCTNNPGPSSTIPYPGCAKSSSICPNPPSPSGNNQCDTIGNNCNNPGGVLPTGNRNIGTCYMGYTNTNTLYYFTFLNDVGPASGGCEGSVSYNGSKTPIINPPGTLCQLDLTDITAGKTFTKCTLDNDCYSNTSLYQPQNATFNPQIMAAINRNVGTNKEASGIAPAPPYTLWTITPPLSPLNPAFKYYKTEPYNFYAKIWHEIGFNYYAYGFGYDDAGGQSTTYTPNASTLSNLVVGIGW